VALPAAAQHTTCSSSLRELKLRGSSAITYCYLCPQVQATLRMQYIQEFYQVGNSNSSSSNSVLRSFDSK
jgi:hypothetical protein